MPILLKRKNGKITPFRNAEFIPVYYFIPKSILNRSGKELWQSAITPIATFQIIISALSQLMIVNDMVDSDEGENEIAPFRNVMNEMYARDISRKVRSAHRIRGNCGEPLSQPPYGYVKSPENKKKWIHRAGSGCSGSGHFQNVYGGKRQRNHSAYFV